MPRKARIVSETAYYHVISRGNNKQIIFESDNDYRHFIEIVFQYSKKWKVKIPAYCLMNNHIHLLIYDPETNISNFMKGVNQKYAQYFNNKYGRIGTLFQDRYKSLAITDKQYLQTVFMYIIQNPARAKICSTKRYKWNSYKEYSKKNSNIDEKSWKPIIGDIENINYLISQKDGEILFFSKDPINNFQIRETLKHNFGIANPYAIQRMDIDFQKNAIRYLKHMGLKIKDISRITGISKNIVARI